MYCFQGETNLCFASLFDLRENNNLLTCGCFCHTPSILHFSRVYRGWVVAIWCLDICCLLYTRYDAPSKHGGFQYLSSRIASCVSLPALFVLRWSDLEMTCYLTTLQGERNFLEGYEIFWGLLCVRKSLNQSGEATSNAIEFVEVGLPAILFFEFKLFLFVH